MIRIVLLIYLWAGASAAADERLSGVTTWMYQLQGLDEPAAWGRLAATDYDMLVLEPGQNFAGWAYGTGAMVRALRHKPDGSRRVLLAYVNIGQAEDYRDYWRPDWVAPVRRRRGVPSFLIPADPDGWPGNYPVAYWDPRWQAVWLGPGGIVSDLVRLGFDGVWLDWVGAYDHGPVRAAAAADGVSPEGEMIGLIERLVAAGRDVDRHFLVVPQSAVYLLDADPSRYLRAIDGLGVEDIWFSGEGDADWSDPAGGKAGQRQRRVCGRSHVSSPRGCRSFR
ncbi:MAG: hypothetical protein GY717_04490 [Rhodobacteraceae bacterium]|nr:hypothetical protein [Paracoccaceae bacterium]